MTQRSGLRLRLRIAVSGRAAHADPPRHPTCGKFNSNHWLPVSAVSDRPLAQPSRPPRPHLQPVIAEEEAGHVWNINANLDHCDDGEQLLRVGDIQIVILDLTLVAHSARPRDLVGSSRPRGTDSSPTSRAGAPATSAQR